MVGVEAHREYITEQEPLPASDNRDEAHSGEITQWVAWQNYADSIDPLKRPILSFLGSAGLAKRQKAEDGAWSK